MTSAQCLCLIVSFEASVRGSGVLLLSSFDLPFHSANVVRGSGVPKESVPADVNESVACAADKEKEEQEKEDNLAGLIK